MISYSIRDLELLSGIKAHTIRTWESRYGVLQPKRTDTNIRYYDKDDLKLLLNICLLNDKGFKISKISSMSAEEIHEKVVSEWNCCEQYESQVNALTVSMIDLDEVRFEKIISKNILQIGFENTMMRVIYPFFEKIGILWQTCSINPAQEHFISNLIRQKMIVAIDGQTLPVGNNHRKYVLYLPEDELHELGLLFASFIVKSRGNRSIYLGQNLPFADLGSVYDSYQPDFIFTILTIGKGEISTQAYVDKLANRFKGSMVIVTGRVFQNYAIKFPPNVLYVPGFQEMIDFVEANSIGSAN